MELNDIKQLDTPYYIIKEDDLRRNLKLITDVAVRAEVKIIMALKANALWKTFGIISDYNRDSTASSIDEMHLANDYLGGNVHAYCPVYTSKTILKFMTGCTHITFNSLPQFMQFQPLLQKDVEITGHSVSGGLRINPECSVIETDIYNPCLPGSRFGVDAATLNKLLPDGELPERLDGFHFHALCESTSYDLEKVLEAVEMQFGNWLPQLKWLNMGGGHLMTKEGYDRQHLIETLKKFKNRHPNLHIIMEPGSAFTWQTGDLVASVLDVVENNGIKTAILDTSFACHMPDTLEMPYKPIVAEALPEDEISEYKYRLGGNTCLSGDFKGDWYFEKPLKVGDRLTFKDMNHYTTVKTHCFNGVRHPAIYLEKSDGKIQLLRKFAYPDYRDRMD